MVDADIVGSKLPEGQTRHWLVNGVTVNGRLDDFSCMLQAYVWQFKGRLCPIHLLWQSRNMQVLGQHLAAAPIGNTLDVSKFSSNGPFSYVVLVYSQPSSFKAPTAYSQANMGVSAFDFNGYVKVRSSYTFTYWSALNIPSG